MRQWTNSIFKKNEVLTSKYITKLSQVPTVGKGKDGKAGYDFDLQVKILQLFRVDEYQSEMRVIDESGEIWHSSVYNVKYRSIKEGQYVRIRAASLVNHMGYTRTFGMRPYSNILTLPYPCKLAESMMFDEVSEVKIFEKSQLQSKDSILMHPIIVSEISDKKVSAALTNLDDIKDDNVHRVRVSVSHVSAPTLKLREKTGELKACPKTAAKNGQDKVICF